MITWKNMDTLAAYQELQAAPVGADTALLGVSCSLEHSLYLNGNRSGESLDVTGK